MNSHVTTWLISMAITGSMLTFALGICSTGSNSSEPETPRRVPTWQTSGHHSALRVNESSFPVFNARALRLSVEGDEVSVRATVHFHDGGTETFEAVVSAGRYYQLGRRALGAERVALQVMRSESSGESTVTVEYLRP